MRHMLARAEHGHAVRARPDGAAVGVPPPARPEFTELSVTLKPRRQGSDAVFAAWGASPCSVMGSPACAGASAVCLAEHVEGA